MEEVLVHSHGSEPIKNKIHQLKFINVQSKSMTKLRNNFEVLKNILSVADLLNSLELKDGQNIDEALLEQINLLIFADKYGHEVIQLP